MMRGWVVIFPFNSPLQTGGAPIVVSHSYPLYREAISIRNSRTRHAMGRFPINGKGRNK